MEDVMMTGLTSITNAEQASLLPSLQKTANEMRRLEAYVDMIDEYRTKATEKVSGCIAPILGALAIIPGTAAVSSLQRLDADATFVELIPGFAGIIITGIVCLVIWGILATRNKKQREEYSAKLPALEKEATAYLLNTQINIIPKDYRSSFALDYMAKCLVNGKADTWRECVELWEQQLHRWTVEINTAEAAEHSAEAAKAAKAAAFFSAWRK